MKRTVIVDSPYICFRSMIALRGLSWEEQDTGVSFGFLRQIQLLAKLFDYPRFVFAWDSEIKPSHRQEFFPEYKKKKTPMDSEMIALLEVGKPQFRDLRKTILPLIGFKNQIVQPKLEADDMIAQLVIQYPNWNPVIIISSDNDLYPLISERTSMFDVKSKTTMTSDTFKAQWGIDASRWEAVKMIAGCDTDGVPGIRGVGVKTAIKYLKGGLSNRKKLQSIINDSSVVIKNKELIKLPHKKTRSIEMSPDNFSTEEFVKICLDYGMRSLIDKEENFKIWRRILE